MTDLRKPGGNKGPTIVASSTKSYTVDGTTTEFNPIQYQVQAVSPELRQTLMEGEPPRLGPEYFQDTLPPNQAPTASAVHGEPPPETRPVSAPISGQALLTTSDNLPAAPELQATCPSLRRSVADELRARRKWRTKVVAMLSGGVLCSLLLVWLVLSPAATTPNPGEPLAQSQSEQREPSATAPPAVNSENHGAASGASSRVLPPRDAMPSPPRRASLADSPRPRPLVPVVQASRPKTKTVVQAEPPPELNPTPAPSTSPSPSPQEVTPTPPSPQPSARPASRLWLPSQ